MMRARAGCDRLRQRPDKMPCLDVSISPFGMMNMQNDGMADRQGVCPTPASVKFAGLDHNSQYPACLVIDLARTAVTHGPAVKESAMAANAELWTLHLIYQLSRTSLFRPPLRMPWSLPSRPKNASKRLLTPTMPGCGGGSGQCGSLTRSQCARLPSQAFPATLPFPSIAKSR